MDVGAHMSISGGVENAVSNGHDVGCEVVQLFTKSNRRWAASDLDEQDRSALLEEQETSGVRAVMVHMAYLVNLASPKEEQFNKSYDAFIQEIERAEFLDIPLICFHPGSHTGQGEEDALEQVAEAVTEAIADSETENVRVLVEGMAGQGTSIGHRFEHLAHLVEEIDPPDRIGVCLDTAHLHAAGYSLDPEEGYDDTMKELEKVVGIEHVYAWHLNDTEEELGSQVDRHHHIAEGQIGEKAFEQLVSDDRFAHLPGVIETPKEDDWDRKNVSRLKSLREPS